MKLSQEKIVIILGVWLFILPFTGFPRGWKTMLTILTSLILIYVGALLYRARRQRMLPGSETKRDTFTETV